MFNNNSRSLFLWILVGGIGGLSSLLAFPGPAAADDPDHARPNVDARRRQVESRAWAETRPDGVHIGIRVRESTPGEVRETEATPVERLAAPHTAAGPPTAYSIDAAPVTRAWTDVLGVIHYEVAGKPELTLTPAPRIIGWSPMAIWEKAQADHPEENPFIVRVDDRFAGVIWVPRSAGSDFVIDPVGAGPSALTVPSFEVVDPLEVVREILGFLPLPDIKVRMNPPTGLVALSSWYWVDGYDGQPFGGAKTVGEGIGAVTIEVRVWPSKYEWEFGDGATLVSKSLGRRYPAESEIKHTYEYSSFRFKDGFPVRLTVTFEAEYRVNNGPWRRLAPIRQTYGTDYPVQELQTVLTRP